MIRMRVFLVALLLLSMAAQAQSVVAQGDWRKADYDVMGQWRITQQGERLFVDLGDDFETNHGPDLHILLSPRPFDELTNANAARDALVVGLLRTTDDALLFKKMRGAQRLSIPDGARLSDYKSILIHCVRYSHLWAGADLDSR